MACFWLEWGGSPLDKWQPVVKIKSRTIMLRVGILFATCVLASTFAAAQEPDLNKGEIKVAKVAGNVNKLVGPIL
jgi:hypothetical protein